MANKEISYGYSGMVQDISQSKFNNNFYFEGKNIRIVATDTQSTGSITNEKGNSLIYEIPKPVINTTLKTISYLNKTLNYTNSEINHSVLSGDQIIIGHTNTRDYEIIMTTDNNGYDCIWKMRYSDYDLTLLYLRDLNFSTSNPIQVLNNFENASIDKIYWIDGNSQIRFLNINHSIVNGDLEELIDVPVSTIDIVSKYNLSEPIVKEVLNGGNHTSGKIQYAYNLYRLNSSQTKLSPLSTLIPLSKGSLGGGVVNEIVGALPVIKIENIDSNFTNIRTYAIKYTSYNETPSISLIDDREIPSNNTIEVFDDGSIINTLSLEEFIFLGSDIVIPKHINNKDNRLFAANYKEINFEVNLDTRAYAFDNTGECIVFKDIKTYELTDTTPNINGVTGTPKTIDSVSFENEEKHDSINLDFNTYKFQKNNVTHGGEGKYLKYELTQSTIQNTDNLYFKDDEIYRLGIQFYNKYGQISFPKWIADFKSRNGNLEGNYNTLKVELKSEFYTWLSNSSNFENDYQIPTGYKILIAERTLNDKTIVASGLLSTMMAHDKSSKDTTYPADVDYIKDKVEEFPKLPNFLVRNCNYTNATPNTYPLRKTTHLAEMNQTPGGGSPDVEILRAESGDEDTGGRFYQFNSMLQLYSPEILFKESFALSSSLKLKVKGALQNKYNAMWARRYGTTISDIIHEGKIKNGLSPAYSSNVESIVGNGYYPLDRGLIAHPGGEESDRVLHWLAYRTYGDITVKDVFTQIVAYRFENNLTGTGSFVTFTSLNSDVYNKVNYANPTGVITYTITPNAGFTTVPYNIKVCSDSTGLNKYPGSLNAATGTQTITITDTFPFSADTGFYHYKHHFLFIDSNVEFKANVSVNIKTYDNSTTPVLVAEKESLTNYFENTDIINPSSSYFTPAPNNIEYNIYGVPELTEKGQNFTTYNNDTKYRYSNSLQSFYSDGDSSWASKGKYNRRLISINSDNNRCITLVTGDDDYNLLNYERPSIETIYNDLGFTDNNNVLIGELVKPNVEIYLGNIYGGNTWEDKHRTNYIEIGNYLNINNPLVQIDSPGDTYVNNFKFLRIVRKDSGIIEEGVPQIEELVEYVTETTVDLKNRSDLSFNLWDNKFQYSDSDYHNYNRVYSQLPNLIRRRDVNYNFKKINNYDTNIISSKLKTSGETIDNWTDILQNEVITLDGKYGAINSLANFNDEIYAIQDKAFAFLSINPRVQIQGNDGLAVELGTGGVLNDYKYLTTDGGTLNKWSVVSTPQGLYFYDALNRSFNVFKGNVIGLSDNKSLHTFFTKNSNLDILKVDNPLLKQGISSGYDYINNEIFITFHQGLKSFTLSYNELTQSFVSFYDYLPSVYISKGFWFITSDPSNKKLYRQYEGNYNEFYGQTYPSHLILNVNPEPNLDCVFDNINFKSEVYLNGIDQPDKTLTHIQALTDYQDSNLIPLTVGRNSNIRRKFRDWNALIPRQGRERIRGPWMKLKVQFENTDNYKLILHNLNVYYTTS